MNSDTGQGQGRWLRAAGALLAGASVALAAYASHAGNPATRGNLEIAALFGFGHGIALAALAPAAARRVPLLALTGLLAGTLLFAGSLAFAALLGWPTRLAPLGGTVLMASWLLYAVGVARR